jgi:hypothetical protein
MVDSDASEDGVDARTHDQGPELKDIQARTGLTMV